MAGVEEVRAGIALANQKMQEGIAALQQTHLVLEEAQAALANATQGSTQEDMQHAHGMLAEALQTINGVQGTLNATIASAEGYSGRL
jgi:replicative DNA helicase